MHFALSKYLQNFSHLFFPHNCEGCGTDIINDKHFLCSRCLHQLPETDFCTSPGNPIEKLFYGRVEIAHAAAVYYFTKNSLLQHILMQLKYRSNKEAGFFLGRMMGYALQKAERFSDVDMLVALPLNPKKECLRGYNQAALLCQGISEVWHRPVLNEAVNRIRFTESQTRQNRVSRWQNMEGVFDVPDKSLFLNRHLLLVDDVITTGATLEACASVMLGGKGTKLSIVTAAYTI